MPARVDMPQPFDLVGEDLRIGGVGHGFESTLDWRVGEGHDERSGIISAGSLGAFRQFHETADLAGNAFTLNRLFVEVFETSAADGSEIDKVIVPVIYGPLIVPGFVGYREYTVVAGDTLSNIAKDVYGDPMLFPRIVEANPLTISNPDLIFVGQVFRIPVMA